MSSDSPAPKERAPKRDSPYCSFKNDRHRLWALVSRDIRLVIVCGLLVFGPPILTRGRIFLSWFSGS